jgi:hypothetical protein
MPKAVGIFLLAVLTVTLILLSTLADRAHAGQYKMVMCAGDSGVSYSVTVNRENLFEVHNHSCGSAGGDPPGENAWVRINENQEKGVASEGAAGTVYFDTPGFVHFKTAGAYTRQPNAFNDGWRSRFWGIDFGNNGFEILTQGAGLPQALPQWPIHSTFGPHLWPGGDRDFWRFAFEMKCVRAAGCDRTNFNATDANAFVFTLSDDSNSQVGFTNTGSALMQGQWVRGLQNVTWNSSDQGSGLRFERLFTDGAQRTVIDYQAAGQCNATSSAANGEFARTYQPCPTGGPFGRSYGLDTGTLSDGQHTLQVCTQDYGQYRGLNGTGGQTCDQRTIRTDNTAPGAPAGLFIVSANPQRYLDNFAVRYSLPPNGGSPVSKIHYDIINAANEVVMPEQTVSGTDLTELKEAFAPKTPGDYRLRVWLADQVGWVGPASTTPIPRDTTPPAAPQDVAVTAPSKSRADDGFDLRWRNIVDQGAPVDALHYQVLNEAGAVAVPTQVAKGANIEALPNLESPEDRGKYTLRMWLSDSEGNEGAPVNVPLAYECVRSDVKVGNALTSGLGVSASATEVVQEGSGSTFHGTLKAAGGGGTGTAPVCVFSRIITDQPRDFLGLAMTGKDGTFKFPIQPGASRDVIAIYRRDHRELISHATLQTIVHPTFKARKTVVFNKSYARFFGQIPGPHNDRVVIVLQAKVGKGWSAFRRYRTRDDGKFSLSYRFRRTFSRTKYVMRAQVRQTVGYPYLQGNSRRLTLTVLPKR